MLDLLDLYDEGGETVKLKAIYFGITTDYRPISF